MTGPSARATTVDSVLGATVEGDGLGNQAVNALATLSGAVAGVGFALLLGAAAPPTGAAVAAATESLRVAIPLFAPLR